jgi:hypothetical protein
MDPLVDPLLCAPLFTLSRDVGAASHRDAQLDLSLTAYVAQMESISTEHMSTLHLFPVAAAACFLAPCWAHSNILPTHAMGQGGGGASRVEVAFDRNEHVAQFAVAKLLVLFATLKEVKQFSMLPEELSQLESNSSSSGSSSNSNSNGSKDSRSSRPINRASPSEEAKGSPLEGESDMIYPDETRSPTERLKASVDCYLKVT